MTITNLENRGLCLIVPLGPTMTKAESNTRQRVASKNTRSLASGLVIVMLLCLAGCSFFRMFKRVSPLPPVIAVEISPSATTARVRADAEIIICDHAVSGKQIGRIGSGQTVSIAIIAGKLCLDGAATGVSGLHIEAAGAGLITIDKTRYRGRIEIRAGTSTMQIINMLDIEQYLYGVVPREMSASWPEEALKAQAVAARTYAIFQLLHRKYGGYDLKSTVESQVYGGASAETSRTNKAVDDTRDLVIAYGNELVAAYFHSTCGGKTENDGALWGGTDLPYLKSRKCGYCDQSPHFSWRSEKDRTDLAISLRNAGHDIGKVYWIKTGRTQTGRVDYIRIKGTKTKIRLSETQFRNIWGTDLIKSRFYQTKNRFGGIVVEGHGWGHGVGMCQWGARGMAERGNNYKQILSRYYGGWMFDRISIKPYRKIKEIRIFLDRKKT